MRYIRSYEEERKKFSLDCHFYKKDYKKDDISIAFKKRSDLITAGYTYFNPATNKFETVEFCDYSHPATSLSVRARNVSRYVSNETPNDLSMERRQDVLVVRLHDGLLVCHDDVSRERNEDVPLVRLHDISNKPQMKHPKMSQ